MQQHESTKPPAEPAAAPGGDAPRTWAAALLRLWILQPISAVPTGNSTTATVLMCASWLACWVGIDCWQSQPNPEFSLDGIPPLAWYMLALVALAALLRRRSMRPYTPWQQKPQSRTPALGDVLALASGAVPIPLLLASIGAIYLDDSWLLGASILAGVYVFAYLARGLRGITGESQLTAAVTGLVFIVGFVWLTNALNVIPDVWAAREGPTAERGEARADSEAILFGQAHRIDDALAAIPRDESPKPKAFFVGFAGIGDEKVFAQEIGLASRVIGERYGIGDRSLSLINDERDLKRAPIASVSALKYALHGLAERMNLDRDVLFLSISSHGAKDAVIVVDNSELPLQDLTDDDLADALRESAIRWRVIIISACYAGGFIESLSDPRTIVIAAAAADRTSFGCSNDRDLTYFGEAFYRDALPAARTLREAFEQANAAIALRERGEHVEASNPQAYFGPEMEKKLTAFDPP
jgi:Peptidase C13 family